jgi:Na+/H+ antiporter NhaD/arsenite permease-like protein
MDLALLVYGISLLDKFHVLFAVLTAVAVITLMGSLMFRATELSVNTWDSESTKKEKRNGHPSNHRISWTAAICALLFILVNIIIPSEKTAYTMVGAYAAQKVAENPQVRDMSGKVLTIINQKLDHYVEQGIEEATKRVEKKDNGKN